LPVPNRAASTVALRCARRTGRYAATPIAHPELDASIRTEITNWNDDAKPFVWHKRVANAIAVSFFAVAAILTTPFVNSDESDG
jgi:hypothetical protein